MITLKQLAPFFSEKRKLLFGLYTFGNYIQIQVLGHVDNGFYEVGVARISVNIRYKRAVYFNVPYGDG